MNSVIKSVENTNYCLVNEKLKISISSALILARLKNIKSENFIFDDTSQLWYYQNYKTKTKIFDLIIDGDINEIKILNNDIDDYRLENLNIIYKEWILNPPEGFKILQKGEPTLITEGAFAGEKRNMYWKVEKNNEKFYIMIIKENVYTKFSIKDLNKVLDLNGTRPTWCLSSNGYISCRSKLYDDKKCCYLHQFILDQHTKDNTDFKETVDHINQDKLDNRRENLRIVNMSEQNKNKDKQARRKDCKVNLPEGIKVLPKFVEYRKDVYDKENNKQREFFIVNHPKLEKIWETTKSNKVTILDKLRYAKAKIELIENKLTESQFKEIIGLEEKMDLPFGIRLDIFREKYHYILDIKNNDQRYNAKMILHSLDVQEELNKFIDTIVNVKYPNLIKKYEILNPIDIDEKKISTVEKKIVTEEQPIYPQYISVYEEKGSKYIQYNKQSKAGRFSKKIKILTNDIQKELDSLVLQVNEKYPGYNLDKQKIIKPELFKLKEIIL
jgi:hypothetical protein